MGIVVEDVWRDAEVMIVVIEVVMRGRYLGRVHPVAVVLRVLMPVIAVLRDGWMSVGVSGCTPRILRWDDDFFRVINVGPPRLARPCTTEEAARDRDVSDMRDFIQSHQAVERGLTEVRGWIVGQNRNAPDEKQIRTEVPFPRDVRVSVLRKCDMHTVCLLDKTFCLYP